MQSNLLKNKALGAGNFFPLASADTVLAVAVAIELDQPYTCHDGRVLTSLTLPELDEVSDRIAGGYWQDGIRPKDPVALFLDESVRYLVHYVALNKIGAIPVFLNSGLPTDIATRFIGNVGAVAVVSDHDRLPPDALGIRYYETDPHSDQPYRRFTHTDNDPTLIAHTSGTTGVPKAVQFNHRGFFFGIRQQSGADLGARILSALPQSHASAISVLMSAVLRGSTVLLATQRGPQQLVEAIERFRPNLVGGFPRTFVDLCRVDLDNRDLDSVSRWMCTGDANHEQHIRKLVRQGTHTDRGGEVRRGSLFIDNFGSSEFGFAMFRTVHTPTSDRYGRCIGQPFDWIDVEIFDVHDEPVGPMTVGRLALKSPTVTSGYWNNTLLSERNRVRGYWLTGDLAYRDQDGLYYHVDRASDSITTGGGTVYSTECEELILTGFPEIFDCSLVAAEQGADRAADSADAHLVLSVEPADSLAEGDLDDLRGRINLVLREQGLPRIERIVLKGSDEHAGLTGKALKRTMREAYSSQP
ncbi:acyl--CoA ligase [Streptomyces sp. N2-109]|uniref:Acyl--CoA ligase n=1 Tax=Streptomyces gossypii TaxID=2883101 RepID=A0ABT2JMY4_9ACTN|nr:class I adenylate-forming enzyme family protein [Streptomyces gossypii]MCT2588874.1 acyl--CoA ligase [Streptomyces gossypii]